MRVSKRAGRFIVIDDFLDEATLAATRNLVNRASFTEVPSVISGADGSAFRSKAVRFGADLGNPGAGGRPKVYEELAHRVRLESDFYTGDGPGWNTIAFALWKYPAGSRLGWHNDTGDGRRGEFILFLHERWRPSWGGELMLLDHDPATLDPATLDPADAAGDPTARMEALLMACPSDPVAIIPKPNRLVMVKAGTVHQIHRVDETAGDTLRCTMTGFVSHDRDAELARREGREKVIGLLSGR